MRMKLAFLAISLLTFVGTALADDGADSSARADALVHEGIELGKANDLKAARGKFEQAWKLKHSYDIAANLGLAEAKLEDWVNAANHLDYALRTFPANGKPESKKAISEYLDKARKKAARCDLKTIDRAEITVDGVFAGTAPLDGPVYLAPGEHRIDVSRQGYRPGSKTTVVVAGQSAEVEINLEVEAPSGAAGGAGGANAAGSTSASGGGAGAGGAGGGSGGAGGGLPVERRSPVPGVVLVSVGAVGLGLGIGGEVVAGNQGGHAETDAASIKKDGGRCQPLTVGFADRCAAVGDEASAHNTWQKVGAASLAIGASVAAAGVLYLVWPQPTRHTNSARPVVVPVAGPEVCGVVVGSSF